jgi:uncharacterized protein (DUF1499 family)
VNAPHLGITQGKLAPCPGKPNCVCSDAEDSGHKIDPFRLSGKPETVWNELVQLITARPRTRVVKVTQEYLHATETSRVFGFTDDMEFHLRPAQGIIAVRSSSRIGYSDLGVNRKRIEGIRDALREKEMVK